VTAPREDSVLPLAQRLAAYPELWQVVYQQVRQPHYLANFVATLQPAAIAIFTGVERENSPPPTRVFDRGLVFRDRSCTGSVHNSH
jgi:hypothetical protein